MENTDATDLNWSGRWKQCSSAKLGRLLKQLHCMIHRHPIKVVSDTNIGPFLKPNPSSTLHFMGSSHPNPTHDLNCH